MFLYEMLFVFLFQSKVEESPSKTKEVIVNGDDKKVLTLLNKPDKIGENHVDGAARPLAQGDKFVLTPDYIQQSKYLTIYYFRRDNEVVSLKHILCRLFAFFDCKFIKHCFLSAIKSALKQENLNPEIEEKLLQLQRYQEKRMKPDGSAVVVERSRSLERSRELSHERSPSPSPPRRRPAAPRHDDDDEWIEASPRKRSRPSAAAAPASTPRHPSPPPAAPARPAPPPSAQAHRHNLSRLQMLLFKHKELLKKEIIKKRGLLEKELGVEIQVRT